MPDKACFVAIHISMQFVAPEAALQWPQPIGAKKMLMSESTAPGLGAMRRAAARPDYVRLVGLIDSAAVAYAAVGRWMRRWRSRQMLAALDDHQLRDIGVSRADIAIWGGRLSAGTNSHDGAAIIRRRALADLDEARLSDLSESGLRAWREARRENFRD